ncbi:polysaccharide biosynthesis C-terminal domain-containing protein [Lacticaseibacillus baoqingensis]|uniref:Polysaccharide biosynthesis C-terminal domain-containing protein n=2 Tax=Lacticaseibacillus baoqingensis TaxID=2486013 RepID=A0ABW4E4S4_9LACO
MVIADNQAQKALVTGSAWMTAGSIFSRVLGAIYVIPWYLWMGHAAAAGNALFARGYNIYSLFLIISTAGIPSAVSKQVAHYLAGDDYASAKKLFRRSLALMIGLGVISAAALWGLTPLLAMQNGHVDGRMIPVLHALVWPLLLIPPMSIFRGYFQGFAEMAPSAISQLLEQLARVVYMLGSTYLIMRVGSGDYVQAVAHSTFGAFVGAVMALIYLIVVYWHRHDEFVELATAPAAPTKTLLKEVLQQSLPFIILDAGTVLYQFFDQYSFPEFLQHFFIVSQPQQEYLYGLFAFNTNKLVMIVVSLASAMAVTAIPLLAAAYTRHDRQGVAAQIENILRLFFLVMWPSALGMAAVARPLYTLFYVDDPLGESMLRFNAYVAILMGLFTVLAAVMQGLYQNRQAIKYFLIGFGVKICLQFPLVYWTVGFGPLIATMIGMAVTVGLMLGALDRQYDLDWSRIGKEVTQLLLASLVMYAVTALVVAGLAAWLGGMRKLTAVPVLLIGAGIGAGVYSYLVLHWRLADDLLGSRIAGIRKRLRIR